VKHRVEYEQGNSHVVVRAEGQVLADSRRPVLLRETGLPVRYYLPREDVRMELLRPSEHRTRCPFKGRASYWSALVDGRTLTDVVWCYEEPIPEAEPIRGMLSFYPDKVEVTVEEG
jgi:uncharacterized protein (DUF427 family)